MADLPAPLPALPARSGPHRRAACPSLFAPGLARGGRVARALVGSAGLKAFGGYTGPGRERERFRCRIVCAGLGAIEAGVLQATAHSWTSGGDDFGHSHRVARLVVVSQGSLAVTLPHEDLVLPRGTGLLIPGSTAHSYETDAPCVYTYLDLAVDHPTLTPFLQDDRPWHWDEPATYLEALSRFVAGLLARGHAGRTRAERAVDDQALEAAVCSVLASRSPFSRPAPQHAVADGAPDPVTQALQFIQLHHTDARLTASHVARGIGTSHRTLQRAFSGGVTVAAHIQRARLDHALLLLGDGMLAALSLPDIAEQSGYGSLAAMRRSVLRATGQTPTDYRAARARL